MRSLLLAVLLLLTLPIFQECHKRNPPLCCGPEPPMNSAFTGSWQLIESIGGIAGGVHPVPTDTLIFLQMHSDYSYARYYNGKNIDSGRFTIRDTIVPGFSNDTLAIVFGAGQPQLFRFSGDSLFLGQEVTDQQVGVYVRTNPL
jgi:hypothetical protein